MIDGRNLFDQPVEWNLRTYENIRKTAIGQGDDYATGCLLTYLKRFITIYTAIDLNEQNHLTVIQKQ